MFASASFSNKQFTKSSKKNHLKLFLKSLLTAFQKNILKHWNPSIITCFFFKTNKFPIAKFMFIQLKCAIIVNKVIFDSVLELYEINKVFSHETKHLGGIYEFPYGIFFAYFHPRPRRTRQTAQLKKCKRGVRMFYYDSTVQYSANKT